MRFHGMRYFREYGVWNQMKMRCYWKQHSSFRNYGGRGITVCKRWRDSFVAFIEDMGRRPSDLHSLDRIKNSRGYSPPNCRWATRSEQNRNRRDRKPITFQGRSMLLIDWATELGVPYNALHKRLAYYGMSVREAFTKPMMKMPKRKGVK